MLEIITFVVGFISGMYVVTQIEKGIDRNVVCKYCQRTKDFHSSLKKSQND
jgi:hypothetical protein